MQSQLQKASVLNGLGKPSTRYIMGVQAMY